MKFNQSDLERGVVSTGNQPTPPYKAQDVTLVSGEVRSGFPVPEATEYVKKFGFTIVSNLLDALTLRHKGQKVMTGREADIAFRSRMPLDNKFLLNSIQTGLLTEGFPCKGETVFTLRALYNRGVAYKKDGRYAAASPEEKQRADARIEQILNTLADMQLSAYAHELLHGFDVELTKPEHMTFDQYNRAAQAMYADQSEQQP